MCDTPIVEGGGNYAKQPLLIDAPSRMLQQQKLANNTIVAIPVPGPLSSQTEPIGQGFGC